MNKARMIVGYTIWNEKGPFAKTQHAHRQPLRIRSGASEHCSEPNQKRGKNVPFANRKRPHQQPLQIRGDVTVRSSEPGNISLKKVPFDKNSANISISSSSSDRSVRDDSVTPNFLRKTVFIHISLRGA